MIKIDVSTNEKTSLRRGADVAWRAQRWAKYHSREALHACGNCLVLTVLTELQIPKLLTSLMLQHCL